MPRAFRSDELVVVALIAAFCVSAAIVNPDFLSLATLFDVIRAILVPGILAMAVLIVLAGGGIDVSFTAIAVFALYGATELTIHLGLGRYASVAFALAAAIGLGLGLVNGYLVGVLRLPALIATLGTLSAFRGILLTFVGTRVIPLLPAGLRSFARTNLVTLTTGDGSILSLPAAFAVLAAVVALTWVLLNKLALGRAIFALGGSELAAERIGIAVPRLRFVIFAISGCLAGIGGMVHASLNRVANPFDLVGTELSVLAAVVLGGARISGGYGSVSGTMLGVILVALMNNTLIMLGVPSTWQNTVIGLLILLGTGIPAARGRRRQLA